MKRYLRVLPVSGLVVALALVVILLTTRDGGSPTSGAPLPTACENFAKASELFARSGSVWALQMTGTQVFTRDPNKDAKQILMDLIESCDAERSTR